MTKLILSVSPYVHSPTPAAKTNQSSSLVLLVRDGIGELIALHVCVAGVESMGAKRRMNKKEEVEQED